MLPFQFRLSQTETVSYDEDELLIIRSNTATLSHPKTFDPIQVYIPEKVYVLPFQL